MGMRKKAGCGEYKERKNKKPVFVKGKLFFNWQMFDQLVPGIRNEPGKTGCVK